MEAFVFSNNRGVTLIEIMIALVVLLFVSLAMLQMGILSMQVNVKNSARDEAITVAEMRLNDMRSLPFTAAFTSSDLDATGVDGVPDGVVTRSVRGVGITFTRTRIVSDLDVNKKTKLVTMDVAWQLRQQNYFHRITIVLKKS